MTETSHDFAREFIAGLSEQFPAAVLLQASDVERACRDLPALGWTPLMIRRWAEHTSFAGDRPGSVLGPAAILERVRQLGPPPQRPRSEEPIPQDECPEHPGERLRQATCDLCAAESRSVDHTPRADAVRAAVRPLRADDRVTDGAE